MHMLFYLTSVLAKSSRQLSLLQLDRLLLQPLLLLLTVQLLTPLHRRGDAFLHHVNRPVFGPVPAPNHPPSQQQQHQQHQRLSHGATLAGRGMHCRARSFIGTIRGRWDAFCIISSQVRFPSKGPLSITSGM